MQIYIHTNKCIHILVNSIIMYDSIVVVQHINITSICYHTNTGKILCIAPDDLFDLSVRAQYL